MRKTAGYCSLLLYSVLAAIGFGCDITSDWEFVTYRQARDSWDFLAERLPAWVPPQSSDVLISANEGALIVRVMATPANWAVPSTCHQIDGRSAPGPGIRREWWPNDVPPSAFSTHRHIFYSCKEPLAFLAIEPRTGALFYWQVQR